MDLYYHHNEKYITLGGNTFPHHEMIKSMGARFWTQEKLWVLPFNAENLATVQQLCARSSPQPASSSVNKVDLVRGGEEKPQDSWTIRQLVERVEGIVTEEFQAPIWVVGEVQNLSVRKNAIYFDLAETDTSKSSQAAFTIGCLLWKSQSRNIVLKLGLDKIEDILSEDMKMRLQVRVQFYKGRSQLSLQVLQIDASFTKGALALQREALLKELRAKGLDQLNKAAFFSPLPLRIGLISAAGSRAESDFLDQLRVSHYPGEVLFCSCAMQGDKTSREVIAALGHLEQAACQLIVITRGGGSAADLRWFDDREIAMAICRSKVPVIAAIGHHDDYCVAEEVCYLRQKTPTAAAEYVADLVGDVRYKLEQSVTQLQHYLSTRLAHENTLLMSVIQKFGALVTEKTHKEQQSLVAAAHALERYAGIHLNMGHQRLAQAHQSMVHMVVQKFTHYSHELVAYGEQLRRAVDNTFMAKERLLRELEVAVTRHDPTGWLQKGWTRLESVTKGVVSSAHDIQTSEKLQARLLDGVVEMEVVHIKVKKGN
ncbi:MAG: exodeoxyribonuclease VII large subunit [Zetaproteobacteria bacterium]|nr:exodeoxyribonuclease VII large subunit [Zetaproteobacteria bacterium]